jgi:hypothetical protein
LFANDADPTIRVLNSNDNVTYYLWFNENFLPIKAKSIVAGAPDINFSSVYSFEEWRNIATLTVVTWYDQSARASHLTVPSGSTSPTLEWDTVLGNYALLFDATASLAATNAFATTTVSSMQFFARVREVTRTAGIYPYTISYNGTSTDYNSGARFTAILPGADGTWYWDAGSVNTNIYRTTITGKTTPSIAANVSGWKNTKNYLYVDGVVTASSQTALNNATCGGGLRIGGGYVGYFKYLITLDTVLYTTTTLSTLATNLTAVFNILD